MPGRSTCTRCDATLPAPDLDGNQVCISCGLFHTTDPAASAPPDPPVPPEAPAPPPPPPPPPPPSGPAGPFGSGGTSFGSTGGSFGIPGTAPPGPGSGAPFSAGPQKVVAPPVRKTRGGVGCLLVVVLIVLGLGAAVVGSIVWLVDKVDEASATGGSVFGDEEFRPLGGEMTVLREDGEPEQVVALASRLGTGDRSVVLADIDDDGGDVLWEAALVPDDVYSASFVATDDLVVAALGRKVVALDRDGGETAWQADLPDVISPGCSDCLRVVGGQVVAFTSDAQITVVDPADGTARWARRLESASGWISSFDDRLLVVDEPADGPTTVTLTEVTDGRAVASHAPQCPDPIFEGSTIDATPSVMVLERVPDTGDLVAQFAFGRACTTRWEVATGTVRWARAIEQSIDPDAEAALSATDMVTSSSQGLVHTSLAEGTVTVVPAPTDTYLSGPVWLSGSTAMAVATTTRGTPTPMIVAVDVRSREQLWTIGLPQGAEPLILGDAGGTTIFPGGAAHRLLPDGEALRLLMVEEGGRLTVSDVDPATGRTEIIGTDAVLRETSGTSTVYLESIGDDDVVLTVDAAVQVVDLATGTVDGSWTG